MSLCSISGCAKQGRINFSFRKGPCVVCWSHFCPEHYEDTRLHDCRVKYRVGRKPEKIEDARLATAAKIDLAALVNEANSLRPGHKCAMPQSSVLKLNLGSGSNYIIPLTYDDGKRVVARIRHDDIWSGPSEARRLDLISDAATQKAMHNTGVLVPSTYLPPADSKLSDTLFHFYEEQVEGAPRGVFSWDAIYQPSPSNPQQLSYLRAIAKWFLQLETVHFDKVGSITYDSAGMLAVGPLIDTIPLYQNQPYYLGPYCSAKHRYHDLIDCIILHIMQGNIYHPMKLVEGYLVYRHLYSYIENCRELEQGPWYIKHADDKGDHIMFNEEGDEVCAVIDWQWAYTTSKMEAFSAPTCLMDQESVDPSVQEMALANIYELEHNRPDLAECVRSGRKYTLLNHFFKYDVHSLDRLQVLRASFGRNDLSPPDWVKDTRDWIVWQKEICQGDERLAELIEKETVWRTNNVSLAKHLDKEEARMYGWEIEEDDVGKDDGGETELVKEADIEAKVEKDINEGGIGGQKDM